MELKNSIEDLTNRITDLAQKLNIKQKKSDLKEIEDLLEDRKNWEDRDRMISLNKKKTSLEKDIHSTEGLLKKTKELHELYKMAVEEGDEDMIGEINSSTEDIAKMVRDIEIDSVFFRKEDKMSCFLEINAGAGGADSQDLAGYVLRMYNLWAVKKNHKVRIVDTYQADDCGIKQATLEIEGKFAFGKLRRENGIHRFVRISPFNANGKRQTSFVSVFVYPAVEENKDLIELEEKDLRIETFRSSGAGGQHVNTTDSAIRVTHIPTKISSQCQSQRSQSQNKKEAMKMLRAKLFELKLKETQAERDKIEKQKSDISWGHQVRNYVFHPYKLIKDLRSGYETSQLESVLDGDLDDILNSLLIGKTNN